jgi:hypothetical protein
MARCNEIVAVPLDRTVVGYGSDANKALDDFQVQANAQCGKLRAERHVPCSEGKDCLSEEKCRDFASVSGTVNTGPNPGGGPGKEYKATLAAGGSITCKCQCEKPVAEG